MNKVFNKKLPTILAVSFLLGIIGLGIFLAYQQNLLTFQKEQPPTQLPAQPVPTPTPTPTPTPSASSETVTLLNPQKDGEQINTVKPEFFGEGPAGTVVTIKIESDPITTGSTTVNEQGEWRFTPPADLAPGKHTISLSFINASGQTENIVRSFVVLAAGESDLPALTSTPSASLEPTPSPSPEESASPSPSPEAPARVALPTQEEPMPRTGTPWPTIILGVGGVVLVVLGILL